MVTFLTGTSNGVRDVTWMPCTDASDFAETLVCLAGQLSCVPTRRDTLETTTLGHGDRVDHLVFGEDLTDGHLLLEMFTSVGDFRFDRAAVQLNLHDVRFLLAFAQELRLRVRQDTDHLAVLDHLLEVVVDRLLARLVVPLLGILRESLAFRRVPVLVETTTAFLAQVLSVDRLVGSKATWRHDVTDHADDDHRWCFDDRHSFDGFLLVQFYERWSSESSRMTNDTYWKRVGRLHGRCVSYLESERKGGRETGCRASFYLLCSRGKP